MNLNKKKFNYKVVDCFVNYNFGIDHIKSEVLEKNFEIP